MSDQEPKRGEVVETNTNLRDAVESMVLALSSVNYVFYLLSGAPYGRTEEDYRRWSDEVERNASMTIDGEARPMPPMLDTDA